MVGAEALMRWQRGGKLVPPAEFIPLAEETGFIVTLGEWVLLEACAQAQAWQARHPGLRIAVNLSARQFGDDRLAGEVAEALADSGLPARLLELEITESALMGDFDTALATLNALRATAGVVMGF